MLEMSGIVIVGVLGFAVNILVLSIVGTWKLSRVEAAIVDRLSKHQQETDDEFGKVRREFGETIAALREKVREIELFVRDTFVRRETFFKIVESNTAQVRDLGNDLKAHILRLEKKIDDMRPPQAAAE